MNVTYKSKVFEQIFKPLYGKDCLQKYGKNAGKILTNVPVSLATLNRGKVSDA